MAESKHQTSAFCPRESFISEEDHVEAMKVFSETYQGDRVSVDGIKVLGAPIGHEGFIDAFLEDRGIRSSYPD